MGVSQFMETTTIRGKEAFRLRVLGAILGAYEDL